ncbi:hypothetical protein O0L34_g7871 [Tuta absoluta]|nr:hypothetical protein O0L34_g7871 [Tuta absoluta]
MIFKTSVILLILGAVSKTYANNVVETTHGKVSGVVLKTLLKEMDYYGFMGIPYAAPPVGGFRFTPPQPVQPWKEVLSATKETPPCVQYNNNVKKGQPLGHYGLEDCLYLDIFTPNTDDTKRPIVVFLYNEFLRYSYNKTKDYAPDFFIEEDVVIATISHRLGLFGFLSFEDDVLRGNAGLQDIVLGLGWIVKNAEIFGGDRNRITLLGSQGGATIVDLLIHSTSRNLFNSAILQGGTSWTSMYLQDNARERAVKLAELFGIASGKSNRILTELSEIGAGDLLEKEFQAVPADYNKEFQRGLLPFGPIVDGLVPGFPEHSTRMDVPIMIGFNSRNGLEECLQYLIEPRYLNSVEKDFVLLMPRRVDFRFDPLDDIYDEAVKDIKKFYFPKKNKVTIRSVSEYITYSSDLHTVAIDDMVKHYSNISSSHVFYYYFDYYGGLNENKNDMMKFFKVYDGTWGAAAGDELCYLFKCPRLRKNYLKYNQIDSEEVSVVRKMVRVWSNFAKFGNPTPQGDPLLEDLQWPPYTTENTNFLHIEGSFSVKEDLLKVRFQFWEEFVKKWRLKSVNGVVRASSRNKNDEL